MNSLILSNANTVEHFIARGRRNLTLFAALSLLIVLSVGTPNVLWAQSPASPTNAEPADPPSPPEMEGPDDGLSPEFITFSTMLSPESDIWLISGQIVGCDDPSDIAVTIGGVVSATAYTDVFGYYEVVLSYEGIRDTITADADYEGVSLPQASTQIGG